MSGLQNQAIRQHCKALRMPTVGGQFARLAEEAVREQQSHTNYLEALLAAEMEQRESRAIARLLHKARLPRMKTREAFEFDRSGVSAAQLRTLAEGGYVARAAPVLLVGEAGTGKTHNELAEAAYANQRSRALGRWERLGLICSDELGYVPLAGTACELMFQLIADRAEKAAVIVTTNLPFSEWSQVVLNPQLCKALIDRLTERAHIITTGAARIGSAAPRPNARRPKHDKEDGSATLTSGSRARPGPVTHLPESGPEFISTTGLKFVVTARPNP